MRRSFLAIAGIAVCLAVAGCTSAGLGTSMTASNRGATANGEAAAPAENELVIKDFAFVPAAVALAVGTKVTITNQDGVGHTITSDDEDLFDSRTIPPGESFEFRVPRPPAGPSTVDFHCEIHPNVTGSIEVISEE